MTPLLPNDDRPETDPLAPSLPNAEPVSTGERWALPSPWRFASGDRLRRWTARSVLLILCIGLLYLMGCGGMSPLAFDGGGFPIGGRVYGIVVAAEKPSLTIANASVDILSTASNGATATVHATTDANGNFDLPKVPMARPIGFLKITVTPASGGRKVQNLAYTVTNGPNANVGQTSELIVALPAASFDPTTVSGISLSPAGAEIQGGDSVQFTTSLLDLAGKPLPIMPTLLFIGDFGVINPNGVLSSSTNGLGLFVALFDIGNNRQLQNEGVVEA